MSPEACRVLHFSDVHIQLPVLSTPAAELVGKRLLAALNLWLLRGKLFADAPRKLQSLASFAAEHRVSVALCTGDYTALGSAAEHAEARRHLEALRAVAPLVTLPGNHDLYLPDTLRDQRFERHFGDLLHSDWPEHRVDGPFPFVRLFGEHLAVVGINSARPNPNPFLSSGCVPEAQLAALARILDDARIAKRWVIVMTHYGILRRNGRPDAARHGLENAAALVRVCQRPSLLLVHGHIHHCYHHAAGAEHPWLFCAGSVTYRGQEGFWLYEVAAEQILATPGTYVDGAYKLDRERAVTIARQG